MLIVDMTEPAKQAAELINQTLPHVNPEHRHFIQGLASCLIEGDESPISDTDALDPSERAEHAQILESYAALFFGASLPAAAQEIQELRSLSFANAGMSEMASTTGFDLALATTQLDGRARKIAAQFAAGAKAIRTGEQHVFRSVTE